MDQIVKQLDVLIIRLNVNKELSNRQEVHGILYTSLLNLIIYSF